MSVKVEICLDSVESAVASQAGGANRVELCDNLVEGGTTPSFGMVKLVRELIDIDVMAMIRPRGGDFLYTDHELAVMEQDLIAFREIDIEGVVFGLLNPDGTVDREKTACLVEKAKSGSRPKWVTFHRAFDMARDPFEALDTLIELGVDRILTSGQAASAAAGANLIRELQAKAGERMIIMPAVGIDASNVAQLVNQTQVTEVHIGSSVKEWVHSSMTFQNHLVHMSDDESISEFDRLQASAEKVASLVNALKE